MRISVAIGSAEVGRTMLVKVKKTQQEKRRQQPEHYPPSELVIALRAQLGGRVGNHVEYGNSQHDAADQTDQQLHPGMC